VVSISVAQWEALHFCSPYLETFEPTGFRGKGAWRTLITYK